MTQIFKNYIGKTIKVYIGDVQVKSIQGADHLNHTRETFATLQKYKVGVWVGNSLIKLYSSYQELTEITLLQFKED